MEHLVLNIGISSSRDEIETARIRALRDIASLDKTRLVERLNKHVEMAYRLSMQRAPLTTNKPKTENHSSSQFYMRINHNGQTADASHSVERRDGQVVRENGFVNGHAMTEQQLKWLTEHPEP